MNVLLVYKKSTLDLYRESSDVSIQSYLEIGGDDVENMVESHQRQIESLEKVENILRRTSCSYQKVYRADCQTIVGVDLIIVVGGDGTLLDISHLVSTTPILAINSDPERSHGFFSCLGVDSLQDVIEYLADVPKTSLSRLQLVIDGKPQPTLALNDVLFAHSNPAATSRYEVLTEQQMTKHKNSGLLVSTGAGSSGWMFQEGGDALALDSSSMLMLNRGERSARPVKVDKLEVVSRTRAGMLFIDGPHLKVPLSLGQRLSVVQGAPLVLIGDLSAKVGK